MSEFGTCPRLYCNNQHVLPVGLKDDPRHDTVKVHMNCDMLHVRRTDRHLRGVGCVRAYMAMGRSFVLVVSRSTSHSSTRAPSVRNPCTIRVLPRVSRNCLLTDHWLSGAAIDGAYFGTTFPHLFFMTFEAQVPSQATAFSEVNLCSNQGASAVGGAV